MTLTRREFPVTAGAAAATVRTQPGRRASALLIIADDQGLDLGCYGNRTISTPHIDAFAASAVRFTHGFATADKDGCVS